MRIVTLITDYGMRDHFVGAVKGVILSQAGRVRLVDITHEIEPHNVAQAAFVLGQVWRVYPRDTVHLAVVDPGVGSSRRILVGRYGGQYVVAPDNGLITWVHRENTLESMHYAEDSNYFRRSSCLTFHGRDIMAPVAAHLVNGAKPHVFGRVADRVELLSLPIRAEALGSGWRGTIIYADRFGNLVTNIHRDQLLDPSGSMRPWVVYVGEDCLGPIHNSFFEVTVGQPLVYIGSADFLEIAVNQGRAADRFPPRRPVRVEAR